MPRFRVKSIIECNRWIEAKDADEALLHMAAFNKREIADMGDIEDQYVVEVDPPFPAGKQTPRRRKSSVAEVRS